MQFINNGPDIPDTLLQAHEEGRVVFYCGAGISCPAGLPGFKGLVEAIYTRVGTTFMPNEREAYDRKRFDAALDLLERRLPGQRLAVRKALAESLNPKVRRKGATDTHAALLQLSRCREGTLRLVTTNFDNLFKYVAKRTRQVVGAYAAPMLPIPKKSRWDGVVYLHGLLPDKPDDSALHRLVITSGDFGAAYLTERWAARFVSELFRNYVVCFVGYSIDDPVLRYMMDALAADRMQGETTLQAYAFGDCESGQESAKTVEWEAKGVTPILYEYSPQHTALHNTLKAWAETWRDGTLGKERIVVSYAIAHPSASSKQDDFVGRLLWALSHQSGLPAKRFADFNPAPTLEWLDAFAEDRLGHTDLARFAVPPRTEVDLKLRFSLIRRPAPYDLAPWMALVSGGEKSSKWDGVMFHLARWLTRHLNDPKLVLWLVQRGCQLQDRLLWLIERELDRLATYEHDGNTSALDAIRANAPNAIPGPLMRMLWRLLLTNRVKSAWSDPDLYFWKDRLKRDGLTATLRLELREVLAPKIKLGKPLHWGESAEQEAPARLKQIVDWELVLATDHVHASLRDLGDERWREALPALLDDFQQLLRDALDLLSELGEANDRTDRSYWDLPSIIPHWQNRGFRDWVTLIELLRDAWLETRERDPKRSVRIAKAWFELPYPSFKRLALFAAAHDGCITSDQWVDWLLADDAWWLWSHDTMRETLRLLVLQGRHLTSEAQARLEVAILAGPPRKMYRSDLEPEHWQDLVDRAVWLHLAKLNASGSTLGSAVSGHLASLSAAHPKWKLTDNERDEFSHWMSGTGDPDYEEYRQVDTAPRQWRELIQWLKQPPSDQSPVYEDNWIEICRTPSIRSFYALDVLSREGLWPTERWVVALQAWSEEGRVLRSWRCAAPIVQKMPDGVLKELSHSVTSWLYAVSKASDSNEAIMLDLCRRVLEVPIEQQGPSIYQNGEPIGQPVTEAINHPVGHVAQVLLNLWLKRKPSDNDLLPADIKIFFTQLCDSSVERFRHGRVILASRLIVLFRVDRTWTETYVLPLFNWASNHAEAKAAWEGFLWSPRLYPPLLIAFKHSFLESARHYSELNEHNRQLVTFLIYAALGPVEGFSTEDFQAAIGALPQEGLEEAAQALSQALEGAGDQREDYWKNRIQPFWQHAWPKSRSLASKDIADSLARLSIAAGAEFPSALAVIHDWLQPLEHPENVVRRLAESDLCGRFPSTALQLLSAIIDNQPWVPRDLGKCLDAIAQAAQSLTRDPSFRNLRELSRQHGV